LVAHYARAERLIVRWLHHTPRLQDNLGDRIPMLMHAALASPSEVAHRDLRLGRVTFYRAQSPRSDKAGARR